MPGINSNTLTHSLLFTITRSIMKRKSDSDSEGVGAKEARTGAKASPGASECVSDGVSEELGSAAPITPPLSHSLPSYSVAGEPYSVHASDAVAGDERVEEWFAKLNHSLSKSSKHFDSRIRAVVGLDCEWCPVSE
jgi:VIT1/CCC1 family predicted Fe2+/Mn2+ transporter